MKNSVHKFILLIFFVTPLLFFAQKAFPQSRDSIKYPTNPPASETYTYVIIPAQDNSYGYDIYIGGKMFIHQPSIPALPGNKGFETKKDAEKVAKLVIEKIKKGEIPPAVTIDELKKLNVLGKQDQ